MVSVEFDQAFLREFLVLRCQCSYHHCLAIVCLNVWCCGICGLGWRSRYSASLRAGRSGDRIPVWAVFLHPSIPALGPIQFPVQWVPVLFRGVKRPVRGVGQQPPSSAEVKERAALVLYMYSPSGPSWHIQGWTLPLPLPYREAFWSGNTKGFCLSIIV